MFEITMIFTALTLLLGIYISNKMGTKPNGNMILGLRLPPEAMENAAVTQIARDFARANNAITLVLLLLAIPFGLLPYVSLSMIYLVAWSALAFALYGLGLGKYYDALRELKQQNQWWAGDAQIIYIDTEVSRLKGSYPISRWWYVLPVALAALPFIVANGGDGATYLGFAILGALGVLWAWGLSFMGRKATVYSSKTEINQHLNRLYQREWSKYWLCMALAHSGVMTLLCWLVHHQAHVPWAVMALVFTLAIAIIAPAIFTHSKIRQERNRLLQWTDTYTDQDIYWHRGIYNNPNDSNWFVEKRIGIGMTINMGKRGAKAIIFALIGGSALLVLGLGIYLLPLDFGSIAIETSPEHLTIQAPFGGYNVYVRDIKSIALVDTLPTATRTRAATGHRLMVGRFWVIGHGESHVFVHRDSLPVIVLELPEGHVFVNTGVGEDTVALYHWLRGLMP